MTREHTYEDEHARSLEMTLEPGYYWATNSRGERDLVAFVPENPGGRFRNARSEWGTDLSFADIVGPIKPPETDGKGPGVVTPIGSYYWAREYVSGKVMVVFVDWRRDIRPLGGVTRGSQYSHKLISKAITEDRLPSDRDPNGHDPSGPDEPPVPPAVP